MDRARIDVADALRAFALAGILQVNIQSFAWGVGDPLGPFIAPPGALDASVYLLLGTFASSKFLSIFAFLFGFGFALQWRSLRRTLPVDRARAAYRRRLVFLLALGIGHGVLLYYGDILTAYALVGFLLLRYADMRPRALIAATMRWWLAFAVLVVVSTAVFEWIRLAVPASGDPAQLPPGTLERFTVYTQAGFLQQIGFRVGDYWLALGIAALLGVPQLMGLFLLGAVAGRLGWLARPQRYARLWRAAAWIGAAALPFAAAAAWLNFLSARDVPGDPGYIGYALGNVGALVACLYVAAFVRRRQRPIGRLIAWLAPAGRMPLTNYVTQSAAMGALLSGWGLGLGDDLGRLELATLALLIVAAQVVISRQWIARVGVGPLEALWRRVTYGPRSNR